MQAVMMGNIAASVAAHIAESVGYVEEDILKGVVKEVLPDCGLVIEADRDELKNNNRLGGMLYHEVDIVPVSEGKGRDDGDGCRDLVVRRCPCCGGRAHIVEEKEVSDVCSSYYVMCDSCGLRTHSRDESETVVEDWNIRIYDEY